MATTPRSQIPLKFEFLGKDGKVTQPWAFFLQTLYSALPPGGGGGTGSGFVIDGTAGLTGPTTLYQGPAGSRGSTPAVNAIYIADDTGQIFTAQGGQWQLQLPAFTGDVTKAAFSSALTLAKTGVTAGTYGAGNLVPVITVDDKGRITSASSVAVEPPSAHVPGKIGDILYKIDASGNIGASEFFQYDDVTGDLLVGTQITFVDPAPTFKNLSPAVNKGDLITSDGLTPTVLPVGSDGFVLMADSASANGVKWTSSATSTLIEVPFHYGDATPKPLGIVIANKLVLSCSIRITTAFDGIGATLMVGSAGTPDDIMTDTDNSPGVMSSWSNSPNTVYGVDENVYLTITPGAAATAGSGLLIITVQQ